METSDPQIFAVVPTCAMERDRYFQSVCKHLATFVHPLIIPWEDLDGGMLKHESAWRTTMLREAIEMWKSFEVLRPEIDWILVNDADEYVVVDSIMDTKEVLTSLMRAANDDGCRSMTFALDELWQLDPPKIRIDKAWAGQRMLRMFRWFEGMSLALPNKRLACGSIPEWSREVSLIAHPLVRVMHAGYADPSERPMKYARYQGRPEHGSSHIESIMDEDVTLKDVPYEYPEIWRGSRVERSV